MAKPVFIMSKMRLDKVALSIVDKGASGDDDNRPEIVLFKRFEKTRVTKMWEAIKKMFKGTKIDVEKMGLSETVGALDELKLSPEQMAGVLKVIEAFAAPSKPDADPKPAPMPEEKAEGDPVPPKPEGKEEDEEMAKRSKEFNAELKKRDDKIAALEAKQEMVELSKRADELEYLPGSRDETIALLKRIGDDEAGQEMLNKLNKASKESPLLKAAGVVSHEDENGAIAVVKRRVKAIQDKEPDVTAEAAQKRVFTADPELYPKYRDAHAEQH